MDAYHLDDHGQPFRPFSTALISNYGKVIDQLVGLARGILIDGVVNDAEATGFKQWVEKHAEIEKTFPFDDLTRRLRRIFQDGVIDAAEREELTAIMRSLTGLSPESLNSDVETYSATFPIDQPPPTVTIKDSEFVVTGRFSYGTRNAVWDIIESLGGSFHETPRRSTRYVVIGHFASRDWIHTTWGRKIERAVELRESQIPVAIISEEHWRNALPR